MKIIVIGPSHPWRGGIAHHTDSLVTHLAKKHQVRIITFRRQYPSLLFPGSTQYEEGRRSHDVESEMMIDSVNPFNWIMTGRYLRKTEPDVILFAHSLPFFGPCYGTIAAIARWRTNVRAMFLCHNVLPHERRPGDRFLTRLAFRFGDAFVVMSESVRRDLNDVWPEAKIGTAHHPVYERFGEKLGKKDARARLGISAKRIILFFGYVRPYKGLSVLLDAISRLENITLLVVGEFYEKPELYLKQIQDLGIGSRVRIVDSYVPSEDVPLYFSAADAVIVPYLSATQSGIIQIAYNFDRPVIASDVGGLSEVIEDGVTGSIVPAGDPEALAEAVSSFFREEKGKQMEESVSRAKRSFSWDALVETIESLASRQDK